MTVWQSIHVRSISGMIGLLILVAGLISPANALEPRVGWDVAKTSHSFEDLIDRVADAIKANKMGLVTQANASNGAASRDISIPGNRVMGVYRNDFAVRMLEADVAAGIEAPIRFYLTENPDKTATLSYKLPSAVFAPYFGDGGDALKSLASELDVIFKAIFDQAVEG